MSDDTGRSESDRRRYPRVDLGSSFLVRIGDTVWHAECVNASMGGALLAVHPRERLDPLVFVGRSGSLGLEHQCGSDRLLVDAAFAVVRVEASEPYPRPFLLGVRFVDLDMENSIRLFNVIRWQARRNPPP